MNSKCYATHSLFTQGQVMYSHRYYKLFIETDSPYLSPYISSKKPEVTSAMKHLNKPEYLVEVAKDVAKYRNQSYDYICEITYQNYLNFFGEDK